MSFRIEETLADLAIGDYFLGTDGETVWKIIAKRQDGFLGITDGTEKVIVNPKHTDRRVTQIIYGFDTSEEMQAAAEQTVKETLGGTVVARKIEPGDWQMPSLFEMYDDAIQLKAHIMLHHSATLCGPEASLGDLREVHDFAHILSDKAEAPDHTHEEK